MATEYDAEYTLAADGNSFESGITLGFFNKDGKVMAGEGEASGSGKRSASKSAASAA